MLILLAAFALATSMLPHEFYISILTVVHDPQDRQLQLTWRMTTHDIEHVLEPDVQGRKLHLGTGLEIPEADTLLRSYILGHVEITVDGRPVQLEFLGREVEMEDMYCYLLVNDVPAFQTLTIQSTLLFDMFDEQENVVHLGSSNGTRTHTFRRGDPPFTFRP